MTLHYKSMEWNDKKVILGEGELNPQNPVKLLVGFHGAESTPENMLVHGNRLQLENTFMLFPEAPIDAGEGRWSWWPDGPRQKEAVDDFLEFSAGIIDKAHDHLKTRLPDADLRTCLWGFSQGGAASLVYTLFGRHPLHKVASVCGFLPEIPDMETAPKPPVPILGIFGANDDIVPSFLAEHALDEMKSRGHLPTLRETSQGHELNAENLSDLRHFFTS
ncbi:phospholipase [Candidatus Nitromaritima sp. SCGC AAA799-C22]|nr:phospholipase [Candidatus Nitromaritima sp. SCGC AAA799-C22]